MTTFEILDQKLDHLGGEMRSQTRSLGNIETHAKAIANIAAQDQKDRTQVYTKLTDALLKQSRNFSIGMLFLIALAITSIFKQEISAKWGDSSFNTRQEKHE